MHTFTNKQIAIARAAGALASVAFDAADRTPEQANAYTRLIAACGDSLDAARECYVAASVADPVKRKPVAKPAEPAAEQPKPEKPSKPHAGDKRTDYEARVALVSELRDTASVLYNGPSLAVRRSPKHIAYGVYSDLFDAPAHRTVLAKLSVRDESFLFTVLKRGDKAGAFDPAKLNLDAGVFSRLCSVGFIVRNDDGFALSPDALTHARKAAKRAA